MECLFGIQGKDFCLLAADTMVSRSIVTMKHNEIKHRHLNPNCGLVYAGEPGDTVALADYLQANISLYSLRNDGVNLGPQAASAFCRRTLADSLRSRSPYNVNLLVGGVDAVGKQGELYWIDYLGSCVRVPFACHGYAGYFCMGLLDNLYKPDLSKEQAVELLKKCIHELKVRFVGNLPAFSVRIYNANGSIDELML